MKKIVVSSLVSLFLLSCSVAPNSQIQEPYSNSRLTTHDSLVQDTSSPSLLTAHSSLNFSDMEKEYKSFSTKALSDAYVKRMFGKYLAPVNSVQLTRQLEFSRYLKANSDSSYETSLKNMFSQTPALYDQMIGIGTISNKMSTESATFGTYVIGLSPYPGVPTATTATNITSNSFTANWNTTINATGYKLFVNSSQVYSGSGNSFNVTGLTPGSTYNYYVKGINNAGESQNSNTISATMLPNAPGAPVATAAGNIAKTSFTANWNSVSGATSYKLFLNGNQVYSGSGNSFNATGMTPDTNYNYYVKAINTGGESSNSNTITLKTLSNTIIPTGLIINLDAGNSSSYPGSGTSWSDLSGNGNNGTLNGGATYDTLNGGSIVFDGVNDYLTFPKTYPYFNTTYPNGLTISAWLYIPSDFNITNTDGRTIFYKGNGTTSGANAFHLSINDPASPKFRFWIGVSTSSLTFSNPITLGRWYNVSVVYQSSPQNVKIYVNKVLEGNLDVPVALTVGSFSVLGNLSGGGWNPKYKQSTLLFYDTSLSSAEIAQNFDATKSRYGL